MPREPTPPAQRFEKVLEDVRGLGLSNMETDEYIALVNNNRERVLNISMGHEILFGRIDVHHILEILLRGSTPPPRRASGDSLTKLVAETCAMAQRQWQRLQHLVHGDPQHGNQRWKHHDD